MISREMRRLMEAGSSIRDMWTEGRRLKELHGAENVADMTLGNPALPPPPELTRALEAVVADPPDDLHRYTPNAGHPEFRESVAAHLDRSGLLPGARGAHIVATTGASAATNIALRAILEPGDEVVILAPYFPDYPAHVLNYKGSAVTVRTGEDFLPDVESIREALGRKTRAVIVNHPNNPSGREYPRETLVQLADVLRERSAANGRPIWLLSDEPYREIRYGAEPFVSPASLYEYGLTAYSWSKSLSLAGERIGYLAVNPACPGAEEAIEALSLANRILGFTNAPSLWQRVIARCPGACVDLGPYRRRREMLLEALRGKGYEVIAPEGTFYLFPKTPGGDDALFVRRAMEDLVLLVPGRAFGWPGRFRIAFCADDRSVEIAAEKIPPAGEW